MIRVTVKFFAATASITGTHEMEMSLDAPQTSKSVVSQILAGYPELAKHKLLFSVNLAYAKGDETVRDGDEIAIFTPVSGG